MSKDDFEDRIRDFLANNMSGLPKIVANLAVACTWAAKADETFLAISPDDGGPTAHDILKLILAKRNALGLSAFRCLEVIGTEVPLLATGKAGFQPSADILACNYETAAIFIFEVKQDKLTERQSVTELAAYSQGLQNRFWGLSPVDHVWVPVSTEWRTIVRAAFANEALWGQRAVIPMRFHSAGRDVASGTLEVLNLTTELDQFLTLSQFSWACFDHLQISLKHEVPDPRTVIEFISASAARLGFSGFVMFGTSLAGNAFPYPHTFSISVHNPLLGALKRRQLELVFEKDGEIAMCKEVKNPLWAGFDLDFHGFKDCWPLAASAIAEQLEDRGNTQDASATVAEHTPQRSVQEMASASCNRMSILWRELKPRLDMLKLEYELGTSDARSLLKSQIPVLIDHVGFFGLMQEAVCERLRYEFHHASEYGDGPVMGDGDPLTRLSSPDTLFQFMELMNFEHDCQVKFEDTEDPDNDDGEDPSSGSS